MRYWTISIIIYSFSLCSVYLIRFVILFDNTSHTIIYNSNKNGAVFNLRACMHAQINKDTYLTRQPGIFPSSHINVPHPHLISTIHTYMPVEMCTCMDVLRQNLWENNEYFHISFLFFLLSFIYCLNYIQCDKCIRHACWSSIFKAPHYFHFYSIH